MGGRGEITIRPLVPAQDAEAVAALLGELGYPNTPAFAQAKLEALSHSPNDWVRAAERAGRVVGVAHLHVAELFHQPGRVGRIMAIVVAAECRRLGVGRALMTCLEALAEQAGCIKLELTSAAGREEAHAFYESLGYSEGLKHFAKPMGPSE
jgi:GNAT superfamily N-acetyltransferase